MVTSIAGATGALFILILMLAPEPCGPLDACAWLLLTFWGFSRWQGVDDKNPFVIAIYLTAVYLFGLLVFFRNGLEAVLNFIFEPSFHLLGVLLSERSILSLVIIYLSMACVLLKRERDDLKHDNKEALKKYQENLDLLRTSKEGIENESKNN